MKLYDFNIKEKRYSLVKYDEHNFSVREYLNEPKESILKGRKVISEFVTAYNFFGVLEYALRKVLILQGIPKVKENEIVKNWATPQEKNNILHLKPREVNESNVDEVKKFIEDVLGYEYKKGTP